MKREKKKHKESKPGQLREILAKDVFVVSDCVSLIKRVSFVKKKLYLLHMPH